MPPLGPPLEPFVVIPRAMHIAKCCTLSNFRMLSALASPQTSTPYSRIGRTYSEYRNRNVSGRTPQRAPHVDESISSRCVARRLTASK